MIASPTINIKAEEEREEDVGQVHIQDGEDCVDLLTLEALTISCEYTDDERIATLVDDIVLSAIDLALVNASVSTSGDVLVAFTASLVHSTIDIGYTNEVVSVSAVVSNYIKL